MALTQGFGTWECISFRQRLFLDLQPLAMPLAEDYKRQAQRSSYRDANLRLLRFHERLVVRDLNLAGSEGDLREFAKARAEECRQACSGLGPHEPGPAACLPVASRYDIAGPSLDQYTPEECVARFCDERWWFRQVRRLAARKMEQTARDIGIVSKLRGIYASDHGHAQRTRIKLATRHFLERSVAINEAGQSFTLAELADKSVSNPAVRRAELMVRMRGFEEVAELRGDKALFVTLTTPSRMHASLAKGGANPTYDGTSPRQAQDYLCRVWARIRATLDRIELRPYGFRIAEPHHDGTPHWHFLLFAPERNHADIVSAFRLHGLAEDPDEPGAQDHRIKVVEIDSERGSPAGYVAKYVAKNVDGAHLDEDTYGTDAPTASQRIEAWARIWGIRQFQQIGGPPVGVWRELRRLREPISEEAESGRAAADASEWAAFVLFMGGVGVPRSSLALALLKLPQDEEDEESPQIIFLLVRSTGELITTRTHTWQVQAGARGAEGPPPLPDLDLCQ